MSRFSAARAYGILIKEFIQLLRDRLTFAMVVGIPLMQLLLFGYAINSDPKHLPTAVIAHSPGPLTRTLVARLQTSGYFEITAPWVSEPEAGRLLRGGQVQFVVHFPRDFERRVIRGERPALLIDADATDPSATGNAIAALAEIARNGLEPDLAGPIARSAPPPAFELRIHRRYNPEGLSRYNIVPGLIGTILTMTMVMMTAFAMTRERERGTMEHLLATPVRPIEVMVGKIAPFIIVGYIQTAVILLAARFLFDVPMSGSLGLLSLVLILFIAANLALGFTFSTIARNQVQAMQMSFFWMLPSILLSGFMFPFRGMPEWAQWLGQLLPVTHFLRVIRGILLKDNGWTEIWPELWPIALFLLVVSMFALARYRETLD
jgi:ABC-2 type transport system permease protein